jgi:hypothetical protein
MEHMPRAEIFTKPQKRQSPEKSGLCRIKMAEAMGDALRSQIAKIFFKNNTLRSL